MVPRRLYTLVELRRGNIEWESLAASEHPTVNDVLQVIKEEIFEEIVVVDTNFHQCNMTIQNWMECYNLMRELNDDDPLDINIPKSEGIFIVDGDVITTDPYLKPLKIKKVNIGSIENLKFANIGDYWV